METMVSPEFSAVPPGGRLLRHRRQCEDRQTCRFLPRASSSRWPSVNTPMGQTAARISPRRRPPPSAPGSGVEQNWNHWFGFLFTHSAGCVAVAL